MVQALLLAHAALQTAAPRGASAAFAVTSAAAAAAAAAHVDEPALGVAGAHDQDLLVAAGRAAPVANGTGPEELVVQGEVVRAAAATRGRAYLPGRALVVSRGLVGTVCFFLLLGKMLENSFSL